MGCMSCNGNNGVEEKGWGGRVGRVGGGGTEAAKGHRSIMAKQKRRSLMIHEILGLQWSNEGQGLLTILKLHVLQRRLLTTHEKPCQALQYC